MKAKGDIVVVNTADTPWYKVRYYLRSLRKDKSSGVKSMNERFKLAAARYRGTKGMLWYKGRLMPAYHVLIAEELKRMPKVTYYDKRALRRAELQRRFEANGNVLVKLYDRVVAVISP
jgi:hypothetical protein